MHNDAGLMHKSGSSSRGGVQFVRPGSPQVGSSSSSSRGGSIRPASAPGEMRASQA
jgi:hypothetical protein